MINRSLKKVLFIGISILSIQGNAQDALNKDLLSKQCYTLSTSVSTLVFSQEKASCIDKLNLAARQIDHAGDLVAEEDFDKARQYLDDSIFTLQYAELSICKRYIQISHSKLEVQKIKKLFM